MKKTYIIPEVLVVVLNTKTSILMNSDLRDADTVVAGTAGEVKEERSSGGKNIWDEEW